MAFNRQKLMDEIDIWFRTFKNPPPPTHKGGALVNRFVEACRASPYGATHLGIFCCVIVAVVVLLL